VAAAAGALSGYIMTGTLEGTLWGAFSAVTFYGIGQKFGGRLGEGMGVMGSGYSKAELARATAAHCVAGGTLSKLQGGRLGHGLASAGITKIASPAIEFAANDDSFAEATMATIAGGSISSISGGKFANGAVTAAMAYAFNQMQSGNDTDKEKWSEKQIAKATEHAAKEYWESIKNMTPEEFLLTFPDWAHNPIFKMAMDASTVQSLGLQVFHEHGGLGEHLISQARRYTAEQLFEVYGTGAIGGSLGRYPKSQAVWNISTHPNLLLGSFGDEVLKL